MCANKAGDFCMSFCWDTSVSPVLLKNWLLSIHRRKLLLRLCRQIDVPFSFTKFSIPILDLFKSSSEHAFCICFIHMHKRKAPLPLLPKDLRLNYKSPVASTIYISLVGFNFRVDFLASIFVNKHTNCFLALFWFSLWLWKGTLSFLEHSQAVPLSSFLIV